MKVLILKRSYCFCFQRSHFVNQTMVKGITKLFQILFQITKVHYHSPCLSFLLQLLTFDFCNNIPTMSVDISAFSLIFPEKMCCVKTGFCLQIIHISTLLYLKCMYLLRAVYPKRSVLYIWKVFPEYKKLCVLLCTQSLESS